MANDDAQGAPKPPPNLRVSDDEQKECDNCSHYSRGRCTMFHNLPVDGEWVCDDWEKGSETAEDEETPVADQPKTLSDARIRVREHFRRRQAQEQQQNT